jgi:hypothetical protein
MLPSPNSIRKSLPDEHASVSVATHHSCGVKIDGSIACWRDNQFKQG